MLRNSLTGHIPDSIGDCTKLEYLYLNMPYYVNDYDEIDPHELVEKGDAWVIHSAKDDIGASNKFTGSIPASVGNLSQLKWFICSWSDLSGWPDEIFNSTNLEGLLIYGNPNFTPKPLSSNIGNCTKLIELHIGHFDSGYDPPLQGPWPASMANLVNLKKLAFGRNDLTSPLPDMSGWSKLRALSIVQIDTGGAPLPVEWFDGSCGNLGTLFGTWPSGWWPDGAGFAGSIPETAPPTYPGGFYSFSFAGHNLSGEVPASFWENNSALTVLDMQETDLTGFGTDDFTNLTLLRTVYLNDANFAGRVPTLAWGNLPDLARLHLDGNRFVFADFLWIPGNGSGNTVLDLLKAEGISTFSYTPQQNFGSSRSSTFAVGNTIVIDDFEGLVVHPDNDYQWQKNEANITGATTLSLTISNAQSSDSGDYRLVVTNPGASELTLHSNVLHISVE